MTKYANVANGRVMEVHPEFADFDGVLVGISDRFHADFVSSLIKCEDNVEPGWFHDGKSFSAQAAIDLVQVEANARRERDTLLSGSDKIVTQYRDELEMGGQTSIDATTYKAWLKYRRALRDVPQQKGFPTKINWPKAPAAS
ncbi:tail fiber assembly protein [Burkholderia sp. Ac-20349]|uniref:tail fiber assembly protein n=1 Tax=Burkholderia sp. Ac-20349 TaxID=2703893 RepID=UPI00197C9F31|nr:tail fiber assembly protein [Burkholderia sp. Ac-20349]MBN3839262.1 hypothetical protein [Burkholderia sp. Ac-20349]